LEKLNKVWNLNGKPNLNTRFGLHAGNTVVGNVGSRDRMNYTAVGDTVNLASRLEGVNKFYGTHIIISQSVYEQVADQFYCRPLDIVTVKGKSVGIKIYELLAEKDEPFSLAMQAFCLDCEQGIEAYLRQDWVSAAAIFSDLHSRFPEDIPVKLLMSRCQKFRQYPYQIPPNWNGTIVLGEKF
jgi:adenylate cyclase